MNDVHFSIYGTGRIVLYLWSEADLGPANHISVLCTGYGPTGCHDVHRRGGNTDGAIIMNPLSSPSHLFLFHFAAQTF